MTNPGALALLLRDAAADRLDEALAGHDAALNAGLVLTRERLLGAARSGSLGWWEWLPDLDLLTGGDDLESLLGIEGAQGFCPCDVALESLHPADRASFRDAMAYALRHGTMVDLRLRVLHGQAGRSRWIEVLGRRYGTPEDGAMRVAGIVSAAPGICEGS
jgi:hypothetical protein